MNDAATVLSIVGSWLVWFCIGRMSNDAAREARHRDDVQRAFDAGRDLERQRVHDIRERDAGCRLN